MKTSLLSLVALTLTTFTIGCRPAAEDPQKTTADQMDKVKQETREAAREMKDYAFAQKAEFVSGMQSRLDEINRDLDQLSAKIEKASDAAKAEAKPRLQTLREQADKLRGQLDEAKNSSESAWGDVKAAFRKGYDELKDGFQQARQWASEKIAP